MGRFGSILRAVVRRGGLYALALSALLMVVSRYYGISFSPTRYEMVGVVGGECGVHWRAVLDPPPQSASDGRIIIINKNDNPCWISSFSSYVDTPAGLHVLWFPLWAPMAASALWAVIGFAIPKKGRRGACAACGYDRAGLGRSAACPECGRLATTAPRGGSL